MKIKEILIYLDSISVDYKFYGDSSDEIDGFSSLGNYKNNTITWIKKTETYINNCYEISCAVLSEYVDGNIVNQIVVCNSKDVFFTILDHFYSNSVNQLQTYIGQGTYIGPNVVLFPNVYIGYNCVLDGNINIECGTKIYNNVVIVNNVSIGKSCVIESGSVIGHDGFSYDDNDPKRKMIKHYGGVVLHDEVHIGMNTVIARGTIDNTILGNSVKIDTLCHIAHNCIIEDNVTIIAGTILYGSTHINKGAYVTTSVIRNQCTVGENAFVGMGSVCTKDVPDNTLVMGVPAKPRL